MRIILFIGFIITFSIIGLVGIIVNHFEPKSFLLLTLTVSILFHAWLSNNTFKVPKYKNSIWQILIGITLIALIFRIEPFTNIHGGQDQGVYVSMSKHIQEGGSIAFTDHVLPNLQDQELIKLYKNEIQKKSYYVPGVYRNGFEYHFQFYHLHPIWMAYFGSINDNFRFFSLVFFSIISIIFLTLLLYELTHSKVTSVLFALVISVCPLHVYFSRWQVTEIVSLAFISMGLWLLTWAYKRDLNHKEYIVYGLISSGIFSLYFYTRISGFIFIPFLSILFLTSLGLGKNRNKGKSLLLFSFSTLSFLLYCLSVIYGLKFSPQYSNDIYNFVVSKLLFAIYLYPFAMSVAILLLYSYYKKQNDSSKRAIFSKFFEISTVGISLILIIALFFNFFRAHEWGNITIGNLPKSISYKNLTSLTYLRHGGIIIPLLLPFLAFKNRKDPLLSILLLFFLSPFIYIIILKSYNGYQYYYSRYLISELVPFSLLIGFYLINRCKRNFKILLTSFYILYFSFYTFKQINVNTGEKAFNIISQLDHIINDNDLLIVSKSGWNFPHHEFTTPLTFYNQSHIFPVESNEVFVHNSTKFRNVKYINKYLISPLSLSNCNVELVKIFKHSYSHMEHSWDIPEQIINAKNLNLYLYKILPQNRTEKRINFHSDNIWTKSLSEINYSSPVVSNTAEIITKGYHPSRSNLKDYNFKIFFDDVKGEILSDKNRSIIIQTNQKLPFTKVSISIDPFIPAELGLNEDNRELGLDISNIVFLDQKNDCP